MKLCSRCKVTKPLADFHLKSRAGAVLMSWCKVCKLKAKQDRRAAMAGQPDPTIEARFWPKVAKAGPDECWQWMGALSNRGYGAILYQGADSPAHRVAVILDGREVPAGMVVDHICKNIGCVNPRHLRVVTQRFNSTVNSVSPHAANARLTHCKTCGQPYEGGNLALVPYKHRRTKKQMATRACLTCYPDRWLYAVIERTPPPGARKKWLGPAGDWRILEERKS